MALVLRWPIRKGGKAQLAILSQNPSASACSLPVPIPLGVWTPECRLLCFLHSVIPQTGRLARRGLNGAASRGCGTLGDAGSLVPVRLLQCDRAKAACRRRGEAASQQASNGRARCWRAGATVRWCLFAAAVCIALSPRQSGRQRVTTCGKLLIFFFNGQ